MKKITLVILCFLCFFLTAFSGCQQSGPSAAFFVYNSDDTFISEMMEGITEKWPPDMALTVHDAVNSQSVQNQQIVGLIDAGYDLFVINAVDRLASSSIVEKCAKSQVPVIFFNREPVEDALIGTNAFYVGASADSLGKKQAEMAAELFGSNFDNYDKNGDGRLQIVILKGEQGHQDAEERTDNCVDRLKELGFRVDVLAIEVCNWSRREGYLAMRNLFKDYGESIELIFSNNDDMALGAIDYLLDTGVFSTDLTVEEQQFLIIGVDGTAVGLEAIQKGLLYGTVNNDSIKQVDAILTLMEYIVNDKSLDDFPYNITKDHYIYIDGDVITQENLSEFTSPK